MSERVHVEERHAYLIVAHKSDKLFEILCDLLDDDRNDIFIHMDVKNQGYNSSTIENKFNHSSCYHAKRMNVKWGGSSQIAATLSLLELATSQGAYSRYHLVSGQDLPIKSQNYIHKFFKVHKGKEFVAFSPKNTSVEDRVRYYHFLRNICGRKYGCLQKILLIMQKCLPFKRNREVNIHFGPNWFSITDKLARYVLKKKDWITKTFRYTSCGDEIFIQTLVANSDFEKLLYDGTLTEGAAHAAMRLVDWKRGCPYVFRSGDSDELRKSSMLFARKFDPELDEQIIAEMARFVRDME